jgi:hypothetical protein
MEELPEKVFFDLWKSTREIFYLIDKWLGNKPTRGEWE